MVMLVMAPGLLWQEVSEVSEVLVELPEGSLVLLEGAWWSRYL